MVPYVKDTKNALVMRFEPPRSGPEMASLQAAFKEAIQKHFQLEPRELSCEPMPSPQDRQEILFYEASEGGAGVLRQIAEDPAVLPLLARRALEICHFDPDTLEDKGATRPAARRVTSAFSITATSRTTRTWTAISSANCWPNCRDPCAVLLEAPDRVPNGWPRCASAATASWRSDGWTSWTTSCSALRVTRSI